jgi:oligosaccharide reducing-end xylanase
MHKTTRRTIAAAALAALSACGGGSGDGGGDPDPTSISVTVNVSGMRRGTARSGAPASIRAAAGARVELGSSVAVTWEVPTDEGGVQVAVDGSSTATAWKATLDLPAAVESATLVLVGTAANGSGATVQVSFPVAALADGAYESAAYPNLFVDLLGLTAGQVQDRLDATFQQFFHGDGSGETVYYEWGPDQAYILDANNNDIRSEGMSYGMMIAVQMDKREEFDRLWSFARTYSRYASGPWSGYFAWALNRPGAYPDSPPTIKGASNASDGEEWYATALLMAAHRWGNEGAFDYQADAQSVLDTMLHTADRPEVERTLGSGAVVSNMFDAATHQVVFVASGASAGFTDPSYHLPHFYELWAAWADKDQDFWCAAAEESRAFLARTVNKTTGLAADYAQFSGTPYGPTWGPEHANFEYDAFRVGANLGTDFLWFRKDPWQVAEADTLLGFFHSKGAEYPSLWTLPGSALNGGHGAGLAGTNAVLALATSDESLRTEFVRALWDTPLPTGPYRYYDGMLYSLALLQVSGNFRIYHPPGGAVAACP